MRTLSERLENLHWKQFDRAAPVLLTFLILYLCWKLASLFWWVVAPPQVMQIDRVELGSQQPQIPNISSFALFQELGHSNTVDDQLNMTLQGVVVGQPSQFSSAVIKVNDVAERYRVGDVIDSSQYQLAEVYWDRVILRHSSGATREVLFKGIENGLNQPILPSILSGNQAPVTTPTQSIQPNNAIGQAVQRIQEDREQYLKEMGVEANTGNGYEVTTRTPAALRNKLGLQPGDRILSLNGQSVGQGQNDAQLLEQARREGQVKLEIKRGDQVMTIQQNF